MAVTFKRSASFSPRGASLPCSAARAAFYLLVALDGVGALPFRRRPPAPGDPRTPSRIYARSAEKPTGSCPRVGGMRRTVGLHEKPAGSGRTDTAVGASWPSVSLVGSARACFPGGQPWPPSLEEAEAVRPRC